MPAGQASMCAGLAMLSHALHGALLCPAHCTAHCPAVPCPAATHIHKRQHQGHKTDGEKLTLCEQLKGGTSGRPQRDVSGDGSSGKDG